MSGIATRLARWRAPRRVLALRLDQLGDVMMTTPALAALRARWPQASLTLLTSGAAVGGAPHWPLLDAVWACEVPWTRRGQAALEGQTPGGAEAALVQRLRDGAFDAAVIFTVCTQSPLPAALLCRLAGIPLCLAYSRENPYGLLSDWLPENDAVGSGMRHEVARQLALVAAVGCSTDDERLRFEVRPIDRQRLRQRLVAQGLEADAPYVVMHPGASAASRRWPAPRFGRVAAALASQIGCAVVFAGERQDELAIELARRQTVGSPQPVLSLAGRLSLGELGALIEQASVLVANNSAAGHLAAALGTPVVSLYALTNPQHTPWQVPVRVLNHDVECRWCLKSVCPHRHHACLRGVGSGEVVRAAMGLLRARPGVMPIQLVDEVPDAQGARA